MAWVIIDTAESIELETKRIEMPSGYVEITTKKVIYNKVTLDDRVASYNKLHTEPKNKELAAKYKEELRKLYDELPENSLNPPDTMHPQFIQ